MNSELQGKTEIGSKLIEKAERHAEDFAKRAAQHDREASFPYENLDALKASGYLTAAIPQECGGMGVETVHDVVVASSRLARADASLMIGVNMHFVVTLLLARHWRVARAAGDAERAEALTETLTRLVDTGAVFGALVSEAGQDLTHPMTTAERDGEGWKVSGTKIFGTMAPASTILNAAVTYRDEKNDEYYGYAQVPTDAAGVTIHDDWDALGMRASDSVTVSFENVHIAMEALRDRLPIGEVSDPFLERNLNTGLTHAASALGIAESAEHCAVESLRRRSGPAGKRRPAERPYVLMQAAENEIDLAAARAAFGRGATLIDRYYAAHPAAAGERDEIRTVFAQSQIAKAFVQSAAIRIVDRAMAMSGGAGYMSEHPLSRAYRDVRATPLMHALGANVAYELIGQTTLGLEPTLA